MTPEEIADGYTAQENSISCQLVHLVQCLPKPVRNLWLKQHAWLFPGFSQTARAELAKLDKGIEEAIDAAMVEMVNISPPLKRSECKRLILASWQPQSTRISELEAELARVREALEPFAKAADIKLCGEFEDRERFGRTDVSHYLTFGDLRRARTALKGQTHD